MAQSSVNFPRPLDNEESISGSVNPLSERGKVTIDLVGLNRTALVRRRFALFHELRKLLSRAATSRSRSVVAQLNTMVSPQAQFSGYASEIVEDYLKVKKVKIAGLLLEPPRAARKRKARAAPSALATPRFLEAISIRNFRGVSRLKLAFPSGDTRHLDWLMLIGENSAGKSSILQAVTLALLGDQDRAKLGLEAHEFLRRGTASGVVELSFRDGGEPRTLRLSRRAGFRCSDPNPATPTMAFGATRLPPQAGMAKRESVTANLFNPFAPLADAQAWLLKLSSEQFDYAARALKSLLALDRRVRFIRRRDNVLVRLYGAEVTLVQLSDGYRSVISLAADLMATIQQDFEGGMEAAEGVVMLDELGAHLHPRWKMRIAKALREAFPRLQFLVTTHDPLCLRGLRNGEVAVIERTPRGRVFARTDLPPIEGMRVDQILQSECFGLRSAMDPDIEREFDQMYRLKSKHTLTSAQQRQLSQLEEKLAAYEVLGSTRSERLMLSEISRFLAKERNEPSQPKRDTLWKTAQKRITRRLEKELGVSL